MRASLFARATAATFRWVHQVTVTGTPTREAKAEDKKEGQVENAAGKEAIGELRVTDLKMVSKSCAK